MRKKTIAEKIENIPLLSTYFLWYKFAIKIVISRKRITNKRCKSKKSTYYLKKKSIDIIKYDTIFDSVSSNLSIIPSCVLQGGHLRPFICILFIKSVNNNVVFLL